MRSELRYGVHVRDDGFVEVGMEDARGALGTSRLSSPLA
jgi:hypothetical protein